MSPLIKVTISAALVTFIGLACDTQESWGEPWDGPECVGAGSPAMGEAPDAPGRQPSDDDDDDNDDPAATGGPVDEPEPDDDTHAGTGGEDDEDDPVDEPSPEGLDESGDDGLVGDPECDDIGFFAKSYTDCDHDEVFADGCCWADFATSCERLDCGEGECFALSSVPMQAACIAQD